MSARRGVVFACACALGLAAVVASAADAEQSPPRRGGTAAQTGARDPEPAPSPDASPRSVRQLEADVARAPNDPARLVALGLAYWDRNEYPRALDTFRRAVKVGPRSAEAHNWLGVALAEKSDLPAAIAALRTAVALDPRYGRAQTNLGSALAKSGDFAAAVDAFTRALTLEPNSLAAHLNLGLALREKGDLDAALIQLREVIAADPENAGVHYELGQTLRNRGDLADAIASFERAIILDPERRDAYYALGIALKQQSAASRTARVAAPTAASPADPAFTRAQAAASEGELNAARDLLTEALRLDDKHADAHNLLGFILGQQGDLPSAVAHLELAVALRPDSSEARYNLGVALWYSGAKTKAVGELRQSVVLDPAAGVSHAFLGVTLREQGDLQGARQSLQRAIALLPPTAAVYVDLGITYLRIGDLERALGQLEAGLNVTGQTMAVPDWNAAIAALRASATSAAATDAAAQAQDVLGLMLGRNGADSSDVVAAFREAIRLRPAFPQAHNHLGLVLIQGDDDKAGIAALREAIRIAPDYAEAHANLGAALTPTDSVEAIRELEKAVALAPAAVNAQFNLAVAYGASDKIPATKQIAQWRHVITLAPTFARAHLALGKARLQQGSVADAITDLQEAVRLEPQNGEAHYQLGLALARAGRKDEAATTLAKGRELVAADDRQQNASLDLEEGRAAQAKGELEQAAAKFRHALQLRPEFPEARRALTALLAQQGDDPARVSEFEGYIRQSRFKEVEPLLAAYVKERPKSSWGWYAYGYSLFAQQKIGESIQALAASLQLDIRNAETHKILGRNLMIIGRFDAAQVEFEQGLRYAPDAAEIHYNLGKLFSIQDNWEPARRSFEAALKADATYLEAIDALGFALEALGDDSGAVARYQQAIALNETRKGTFASGHVNMSAYYNRTGDTAKALDYARQAIALDAKSDRAWFQRGRAEEREGKLPEAIGSLNSAIALNPRASSYYYVLAGLYRRSGDSEESKKALEMFARLEKESKDLDRMRRGAAAAGATPSSSGVPRE